MPLQIGMCIFHQRGGGQVRDMAVLPKGGGAWLYVKSADWKEIRAAIEGGGI